MGGQFLGLGEAYIPNLSLLVCLEAFKKFVWWGGGVVGWWSRPVLGFSLSQAEQKSYAYFWGLKRWKEKRKKIEGLYFSGVGAN